MWIFAQSGLLMPALVPASGKANPKLTEDGKYGLQVRGRVDTHLRYFMDNYMVPGTFHDEIEYTPQMDYNVRFYTTHEDFAEGVKNSILDIDYQNFKHMVERKDTDGKLRFGPNATKYHSVLNSIWATVQRLNTPGGLYAAKSDTNPRGYNSSWRAGDTRGYGLSHSRDRELFDDGDLGTSGSHWWDDHRPAAIGSTFLDTTSDGDDMPDYEPSKERKIRALLTELADIPTQEWDTYITSDEYALVKPFKAGRAREERRLEQKSQARRRKRNKR